MKSAEDFINQIQGTQDKGLFPESSFCKECEGEAASSFEDARKCAHRIVRAREKTSYELLKRLQEKGHNKEDSQAVVKRFVEVGLVDDIRYTEIYIRGAQSSNKGWQRILRELSKRGIDTELLEPPPEDEELKRAREAIERFSVATHKECEKALRRLVTRGFSYDVAKQAIATRKLEDGVDAPVVMTQSEEVWLF